MNKSGVPGSVRRRLFRDAHYTCCRCGIVGYEHRCDRGSYIYPTTKEGVYLSLDHKVPRSRGGTSDESNLRVMCTRCNSLKGTKSCEVFG